MSELEPQPSDREKIEGGPVFGLRETRIIGGVLYDGPIRHDDIPVVRFRGMLINGRWVWVEGDKGKTGD